MNETIKLKLIYELSSELSYLDNNSYLADDVKVVDWIQIQASLRRLAKVIRKQDDKANSIERTAGN